MWRSSLLRSFSTGPRKVHVHGASGRLGSKICQLPLTEALQHRSTAPIPVDSVEVVVDTSLPEGLESLLARLRAGAEEGKLVVRQIKTKTKQW